MLIPRRLLNILKNGNHHILRHGVIKQIINKQVLTPYDPKCSSGSEKQSGCLCCKKWGTR